MEAAGAMTLGGLAALPAGECAPAVSSGVCCTGLYAKGPGSAQGVGVAGPATLAAVPPGTAGLAATGDGTAGVGSAASVAGAAAVAVGALLGETTKAGAGVRETGIAEASGAGLLAAVRR